MAYLFPDSFLARAGGHPVHNGERLLSNVKQALGTLTGTPGKPAVKDRRRAIEYAGAPQKLRTERDFLKSHWKELWKDCVIAFDREEAGASVNMRTGRIALGPFFLKPNFKVADIEKVILHEFLHIALDIEMRAAHHSMMEQVIIYNLGYSRPANPAGVD